jgi:hypothetical protein
MDILKIKIIFSPKVYEHVYVTTYIHILSVM